MEETDELYDVRNNFYLGDYQGCLQAAQAARPSTDSVREERDCFLYRSYIAQGNYSLVLGEVDESNSTIALRAVRLLALYHSGEKHKPKVLDTIKSLMSDGISSNSAMLQLVSAVVYFREKNIDEALRAVHASRSLEAIALGVQLYIAMNRVPYAEKELKRMQALSEDATMTQLANAWTCLALGGSKCQEGYQIYQELSDRHGSTVKLLNGMAAAQIMQGNFEEADALLQDALKKNASDSDTLANLITVSIHLKKPPEIAARCQKTLDEQAYVHPLVADIRAMNDAFDRSALKFAL